MAELAWEGLRALQLRAERKVVKKAEPKAKVAIWAYKGPATVVAGKVAAKGVPS